MKKCNIEKAGFYNNNKSMIISLGLVGFRSVFQDKNGSKINHISFC